ncbi:MAG: endonuclease domain-containing protein [Desulfuromonadaceae bacterium]|nr:endonuclease domain-containing protein [Desulfuromonadaceae bacterium]
MLNNGNPPTQNCPSPLGRGAGGEGTREADCEGKNRQIPPAFLQNARELRRNQTDAETVLWHLLRNRQVLDAKFRRQHPVENYIADFYCHEHKLIIEIDGSQHFTSEGKQRDALRTKRLNELGLQVLRFDNRQVLLETEAVLESIYEVLS